MGTDAEVTAVMRFNNKVDWAQKLGGGAGPSPMDPGGNALANPVLRTEVPGVRNISTSGSAG